MSSAFVGVVGLTGTAFVANPAVTAAQGVVATRFGVGLAALGLRGASSWHLNIHHILGVITLSLGGRE
ncbi:hypothetical protein AB4Y67_17600 [Arthrobacter sp. YAF17]|uniref:hypothetical protein n=1 Tax=Arthrobacter sp. YAF17 TaxID=3233077 RepID=UPI003F8E1ACB